MPTANAITTAERVCADHAACERNRRTAFRSAQVCDPDALVYASR